MTKIYPRKRANDPVAREGVNYVRGIVEGANCIFHEINQQNDFGNDAFIELVDEGNVRGVTLALQIKSGSSYIKGDYCIIPGSREKFTYWIEHSLPVIGIVYDPKIKTANWANLSHYLKKYGRGLVDVGPYTVKFPKRELSVFDHERFRTFFLPIFLHKQIILSFEKSKEFALGDDYDQHVVGVRSLMRQHSSNVEAWLVFIYLALNKSTEDLSPEVLYFLAHVPGHPDIFYHSGSMPSEGIKTAVKATFGNLDQHDLVRLLSHIDNETGISRGSLGQNVEALISILPSRIYLLQQVMINSSLDEDIRRWAALLCAHYLGDSALSVFQDYTAKYPNFEFFKEIVIQLQQEGYIYLY